jgi:hypothetical protein
MQQRRLIKMRALAHDEKGGQRKEQRESCGGLVFVICVWDLCLGFVFVICVWDWCLVLVFGI